MWIGNLHLNIVRGDYKFYEWEDDGWKKFREKEHELRMNGWRKCNQDDDYLNRYFTYKRKRKKVTLTMCCC
ncbi:hypothetical protein [Heyndrickxia camelliae]|uniref:Uncharacterized protein n=1 Tax=Heyndrickxia camelliae TaxID=1707093 RepID=A0A2N3LFV8_9BACI|nr:hypothetical protein [Heyndrickxia camelliae]PKR83506.1 hypothetical protein CWO92_18225 [Heyndrickxia camelliae]